MTTGKTIALTFVGIAMSLLFNMLYRSVIAFLPRSKHLLISWLVSPPTLILELKKRKFVTAFTLSLSFVMNERTRFHDLSFLNVEFHASFFSLLFHPHQETLFSSSSLSAIRVVSSAYLRLLIFLPAILILTYNSTSPAFCMVYSACKLNKQGDNIQP